MNDYWSFYKGKILETDKNELIEKIKEVKIHDIYDNSLFLTVSDLKFLEENLNVVYKEKLKLFTIYLYLSYPTELSYEEYRRFHSKYKFYHLFVQGFSKERGKLDENYYNASDIDPNIMLVYLKKLNELTKGLQIYSDTDFEGNVRTICTLSNRIVENVFYDIKTSASTQSENYISRYRVPNEIIGLLDNKTVCRGYAGIFRDAVRILGFDVENISGFNEDDIGHEWNQIKIFEEEWYYCDITWDSNNILNQHTPNFLLSGYTDFYKDNYVWSDGTRADSHSNYIYNRSQGEHFAEKSVSRELVNKYLYIEEEKKENWLKSFLGIGKNNIEREGEVR